MISSIVRVGVGGFALCASIPSRLSFLLFLSSALSHADPAVAGVGSRIINIYIYGVGEYGFNCWEVRGARARVILVLPECMWNAPTVSLVFPAFDDTGFFDYPPRQVVEPCGFHSG